LTIWLSVFQMVIYVCKVLPLMTNMDEYEGHDVLLQVRICQTSNPEAEYLDEIQTKVLRVFLLFTVTSTVLP
jgi:hypothetical protein